MTKLQKFEVKAELRHTVVIGVFEARTPAEAMEIAEGTDKYFRVSRIPGMGGVYDLHAIPERKK